jgi:hypoxanthine phosphoribosyltransferase
MSHHPKIQVSWKQYHDWCKAAFAMLDKVRAGNRWAPPEYVTGPARGGLIVAVLASHALNIPYVELGKADALPAGRVLWCDDIVDTGVTLENQGLLEPYLPLAVVARYKFKGRVVAGHYYGDADPSWFVFPYERDDAPAIKDGTRE